MSSRREEILQSAIAVLGAQGVRQFTHRAVDAAAGLPAGSTSNCYRTREALVSGAVAYVARREREGWEEVANSVRPQSGHELAVALATFVQRATGPDRSLTLARFSLFVEAALRPDLQRQLSATAQAVREWSTQWLRLVGSRHPERDCRIILDCLDGILLHQLAFPDPALDPTEEITALVDALLAG